MIEFLCAELAVLLSSWTCLSVPSPGSGSPDISIVTPARSLQRTTSASLFRQAGGTDSHTHTRVTVHTHHVIVAWSSLTSRSLFSVTPRIADVSTILVPGSRTPRYTHPTRHAFSSLVRCKLFVLYLYSLFCMNYAFTPLRFPGCMFSLTPRWHANMTLVEQTSTAVWKFTSFYFPFLL